ncbi:MAG: extracellular solute-binding protein [Saccharofermentans sp.]|nr:extracellular solute-binding protein [Saccharofermentans sp.]
MKKIVTKTIATVAAAALMLPMVASCGKSGSGNGVVSDDTPWFNVTTVALDDDINKQEFDYFQVNYIATINGKYLFEATGMKKLPSDFNYATGDLGDFMVDELYIYDDSGSRVSTIDIQGVLDELEVNSGSATVNSITPTADGLIVTATGYDADYNPLGTYRSTINVDTGDVSDFEEYDSGYADEIQAEGGTPESLHVCQGYVIEPYWIYDENGSNSYILVITDPSGNSSKIDLRESMPNANLYSVTQVIEMGEGKALAIVSGDSATGTLYLDVDFNAMTVTESTQDYSWADFDVWETKFNTIDGYGLVMSSSDGISKVNFDSSSLEEILNYENCSLNRDDATNLTPIAISEDRIVLTGSIFRIAYGDYQYESVMVFLDKADTNPHAGKQILTIAPISGLNYPLCEAVCRFNDQSTEYFATFDDRYDLNDFISALPTDNNQDYDALSDQASTNLGNQLTVDLMGGTGPDIIVDGYSFNQLNNPDYLVDLNDYVNSDLGNDSYYRNIIESGYVGGGIYQIPVTFNIQGIATAASNVDAGQIGFTYEQYETFVDEVCNGTDPMAGGRVEFFITSINSMMDLMVDDNGNFNFDNEAFRALAEYTRDYVDEPIVTDDDYGMGFGGEADASVSFIRSVSGYFSDVGTDKVLLGLPTFDARGPVVSANTSVAVSSQSSNQEGGMEFVRFLMSVDAQVLFSARNGVPVSRQAFSEISSGYIEGSNRTLETLRNYYSDSELRSLGYNTTPADESTAQAFNDMIEQLQGYNAANDGAVNAIIREEIPAFFEGQKTLDQVIQVLQDRAQTVVSERR